MLKFNNKWGLIVPLVTVFMFVVGFVFGPAIYMVISRAEATIFWDGGGDGVSWSDPLNWNTNIIPTDNDDVLIDANATINISAPITVKSMILGVPGGTATTTLNFAYDAISVGAFAVDGGDLTVYPGATITHSIASANTVVGRISINVKTGNASILGNINSNNKGYPVNYGPGAGGYGNDGAGGAAYGGYGGNGLTRAGSTVTYGSYIAPDRLGSGGGSSSCCSGGGKGGGAIKLDIAGNLTVNGNITANGEIGNYSNWDHPGGAGSGGSIWINTNTISGSGYIQAQGGASYDTGRDAGGGGGGRIALFYTSSTFPIAQVSAKGGKPSGWDWNSQKGGAGTVFVKSAAAANGDLIIDNLDTDWYNTERFKVRETPIDAGITVDNLIISKYADVELKDSINVVNTLTLSQYAFLVNTSTIATNTFNIASNAVYYSQSTAAINYSAINWTGGVIIDNGGVFNLLDSGLDLTIPATSTVYANVPRSYTNVTINGMLSHSTNGSTETNKINYTVSGNMTINSGGSINANGKGYAINQGPGKGGYGNDGAGGAAHAGYGGDGQSRAGATITYGNYLQPDNLGSGGGSSDCCGGGGAGGGAVKLFVSGTLTVNGSITANGDVGAYSNWDHPGGAGAGGSIWLNVGKLSGIANITANGGGAYNTGRDSGGGGGGRIAVYYNSIDYDNSFIQAMGGKPDGDNWNVKKGGAGTVFIKSASATNGDLYIDNEQTNWNQTEPFKVAYTALPPNLKIDNLYVNNYSEITYSSNYTVVNNFNIDNYSYFSFSGTGNSNALNITNGSFIFVGSTANITYNSLNWDSGRIVDNGGVFNVISSGADLTIPAASVLYSNVPRTYSNVTVYGMLSNTANSGTEVNKINYTVSGNMTIDAGGSINVTAKGYAVNQGPGKGGYGNDGAGGAAYAGYGGNGLNRAGSTTTYGYYNTPDNLGSGGGSSDCCGGGGAGGGAVKLSVNGTLAVNGNIVANGDVGNYGNWDHPGGAGAGGSIWLIAGNLTGTGNITANGGATYDTGRDSGGGGGGRIAVYYTTKNYDLNLIKAMGGRPSGGDWNAQKGGAGTVFVKSAAASNGDLYIDNEEITWNQTEPFKVAYTTLPANLTIDNLTIINYADINYASSVNILNTTSIDQYSYLTLSGNLTTDKLYLKNYSSLTNQSTAVIKYNTLDWVGGIIVDNGGSFPVISTGGDLVVPGGTRLESNVPRSYANVTINGTLSHTTNSTTEAYKINHTVSGNYTVNSGGAINVTGKGYTTGYGPGAGGSGYDGAGGAAYGGTGGNGQTRAGSTATYGDSLAPDRLGSGGGSSPSGGYAYGGGSVKIYADGNITLNGTIYADGNQSYSAWDHPPGGGSGGSVWLVCNNFTGNGSISAKGATTPDTGRDGGGGGGGRIAIYYVTNTSNLSALTAAGGVGGGVALDGASGTVYLGGRTADPLNLRQFKLDGVTGIGQGQSTNETSFVASFQVQDGDTTDTLTPQVEIKPVDAAFENVPTDTGDAIQYNGNITTASVTVSGLAGDVGYHWQARICDTTNECTHWVSFGTNNETEADVTIVTNASPNFPTIPNSSYFINGQYTNDLQPSLSFILNDPNTVDSIGYNIQIATDNEYNTVIVDYTSGKGSQGNYFFTVGQPVGDGTYALGSENQELITGEYYWRVKAIDDKGGQSGYSIAPGTPAFKIDQTKPANATNVRMKAYAGSETVYDYDDPPIWYNRNDLYFKWDPGSDIEGVKGYCLYLGLDANADPATDKGILGTSPVSITGSTCQFIVSGEEVDFANSALRGIDWLSSSMDRYFFKVKTIDIANNTYAGPDESNVISFYFDNTAPQNVTAISAASGTFSNTADMYFTWPTSDGQNGSDDHSGLLGFQYSLNSKAEGDWIGDTLDNFTGLLYTPLNTSQPKYFPESVQDKVKLGQNIIYFRILDRAGNHSELRTAYIAYGGEAPKFAQGEEVNVIPVQNTVNSFAFEWIPAIASEGNFIAGYYYMINTIPPASYATITSNSATYKPTTSTSVPESNISGLRRGANTIHVVAVDNMGNYSPTNYITATFYLNSDLPDPPKNLTVADSSIKDASIWRAALVWDVPDYRGTGDLTYHIERSEDGTAWTTISTTTGTAYIDTVPQSKRYYWRVATTDTSDQSIGSPSYSNAVSVVPKGSYTTPAKLTSGPAASSITTTTAKITWTTARTCDSKVALGLAQGNYFESETSVSAQVTEHRITLSNLTPGTTYYYTAKWTDEDGNTGVSEELTFTTEPPPQVKEVRLSNLGISSVIVNFTTKNANKARIYYGNSTNFGSIKEIGTSKLETAYTIEIDQLDDGTKYYYKINTFDEEGKEYEGTILDFTTLPRPRVYDVTIQQVINTAQSTLLVTWQSNTSVSSVVTYYPETNPELARDIVDLKLVEGEHKILIKGLFPQMSYIIKVSGKDVIGNEAVSDMIRITTAADSRAPLISSMTIESANTTQVSGVTQTTNSQLIVSWTTDEPSTSQIEFGEGSGTVYNQMTQEDTDLSYNHVVIISGLTPSNVYHLRAISKDAAGNISKSIDTITITPKATDSAFDLVVTILKDSFGFLTE